MFKYRDRIIVVIFLLLGAIGFATGVNFIKNSKDISVYFIKDCFEFGIFPLMEDKQIQSIIISIITSSIKHYLIFLTGSCSWALFPLVPVNMFCISFKMGVILTYVVSLLGIKGFFSNGAMLVFCLFVIFSAICLCYFISVFRFERVNKSRINKNDILFFKKTLLFFLIFIVLLSLFVLMLKFTNSLISGLLNSFL